MKQRADELLVQQGHFATLKQAQGAIMAGLVYYGTERIEKAGMTFPADTRLTVKAAEHEYVSRGGLKFKKAIHTFQLELTDKVMIDIGASTGGFTDCALQHGASYVYAIDVGYNQLAWSLRNSPQVKVMERTNFRYLQRDALDGSVPNVAAIDVSFISLDKIFPPLRGLLSVPSEIIALIKPQFEAARDEVGPSGIVSDRAVHESVLERVIYDAANLGFVWQGLTYSPITGGTGNIEYLAYWLWEPHGQEQTFDRMAIHSIIEQTVSEAHRVLG